MDFNDSPEEARFRARFRSWLAENAPGEVPQNSDEREAFERAWHRKLAEAGYDWLSLPREYGGQGLPESFEAIFNDELGRSGAPFPLGQGHLAQALARYGTEEQKATHLRSLLEHTRRWCQGFSEPGAGSDLAALSTRAERYRAPDGNDRYRISGQKIWTSDARYSQMCFLLARSEPELPKHQGISVLLVPMDLPGIEVRTIVTAYGSNEFAQVFFDQVDVGADAVLGAPGQGWEIATFLLGFERGPADNGWIARMRHTIQRLEARVRNDDLAGDAPERIAVARAEVALRAVEIQAQRTLSRRMGGEAPGALGSIDKLLLTRADRAVHRAMLDLLGSEVLAQRTPRLDDYFWSLSQSIFGGTSQIQRNIVAQRVLGMPRR
ncbi:MAG: acyl-CoA dehydrogenase family protein [Gemmatimonadales bacterium]|jgi:alkylation response protein AidB-like acyl-CoA dehydrogenase